MKSQWECVLQNLGEWVGSFTLFSPQGEPIEDIPSLISVRGVQDNQAIQLVLQRFYPIPGTTELAPKEISLNFSTPNPGALFFETGAFSDGASSVLAGIKTIAEFCLVGIDRRLRIVQVFDPSYRLSRMTLIREQRQGTDAPERPPLTIPDLVGTWQGIAITHYPDDRASTTTQTQSTFTVSDDRYQWIEAGESIELTVISDRLLQFDRSNLPYQILLLPDSSYCLTPSQISLGQPFYLEIGWIDRSGQRQRLVRRYDSTGMWLNATFITESQQISFQI
jgi:Domain of unknown function (DUF3598)